MASPTNHQIALVQTSFTHLIDNIDLTAHIFFEQLFALDPTLKPLFKNDQQAQGRKMIQTLLFVVNALDNPTDIADRLGALSKRHVGYGVKAEYYATVGQALLATIRITLGDAATTELQEAWFSAYNMVADIAKIAAYPAASPLEATP